MSKQYFWIAINGPSCSMCPMPLKKPLVSPTPEQMFGFPTYEEAKHAQHIYLTAPIPKVEEFLRSLQPDIRFGRLSRVRPKNPQPHSRDATKWYTRD